MFLFLYDSPNPEIYPLSLHDALPIWKNEEDESTRRAPSRRDHTEGSQCSGDIVRLKPQVAANCRCQSPEHWLRSEEHTSELQSRQYLVCRLLLEKKKQTNRVNRNTST